MSMAEINFEIVTTRQGALSIRDGRVGEIMHNPLGPWTEIHELYLQPSGLQGRLSSMNLNRDLVLYDVGLGAAFNAMAVIILAEGQLKKTKNHWGLRILSFERDLSLAEFSLSQQKHFPKFASAWPALKKLLKAHHWEHAELPIRWDLHVGDFNQTILLPHPMADLIFYDPYSPKKNAEMWGLATFQRLREKCHPLEGPESLLLTYSRATSVRAALLLAGFFVGQGSPLGLKEETSMASNQLGGLESPLGLRWLERWQRSHQPLPLDLSLGSEEQISYWSDKISKHAQFA